MVSFAIILFAIGLLIIPLGRLYSIWQAKKANSKFSDDKYAKHFMNIIRVVSLAVCVIAMLYNNFILQKYG